ncbi:MAG: clostripain-related cysteine peptidase [Planctomycetota bacterium]
MVPLRSLLLATVVLSVGYTSEAADWTVLVYMGIGETVVEEAGLDDFLEMAEIGSSAAVNIAVTMKRSDNSERRFDDWTGSRRGRVAAGDIPDADWGTAIGNPAYCQEQTLVDFLQWGIDNFPARRYALVFCGHGSGMSGMLMDYNPDTEDYEELTYDRIVGALATVDLHCAMIATAICNGGMWEAAHHLAPHADALAASERRLMTPKGWPWDLWLADLVADPAMDGPALATAIVDRFAEDPADDDNQTMSAIDLASFAAYPDGAKAKLDLFAALAQHHGDAATFERTDWSNLDPFPIGYTPIWGVDVGTYLAPIAADDQVPLVIRTAAQDALVALATAVIANISINDRGDTGLAIYAPYHLPARRYYPSALYTYQELAHPFTDTSPWDQYWNRVYWEYEERQGDGHDEPLDTAGAQITDATLGGASADSWNTITVTFDEEMAMPTFVVADDVTTCTGPGGEDLAITSHRWRDARTLVLEFPTQTAPGTFHLVLGPMLLDAAGNAMDQDADGVNGETTDDRYAVDLPATIAGRSLVLGVYDAAGVIRSDIAYHMDATIEATMLPDDRARFVGDTASAHRITFAVAPEGIAANRDRRRPGFRSWHATTEKRPRSFPSCRRRRRA